MLWGIDTFSGSNQISNQFCHDFTTCYIYTNYQLNSYGVPMQGIVIHNTKGQIYISSWWRPHKVQTSAENQCNTLSLLDSLFYLRILQVLRVDLVCQNLADRIKILKERKLHFTLSYNRKSPTWWETGILATRKGIFLAIGFTGWAMFNQASMSNA